MNYKQVSVNLKGVWCCIIMLVISTLASMPVAAAPIKIMPLGDSITGTPGCWRSILWNRLQSTGYINIDFVGTQTGQTCSLPFDNDCEGHGGILAVDIANLNQLPPWLAVATPDIVMMHLGSNDVMNGPKTNAQILAAYSTMIDQMRANNPNMKILVAQIIPMYTATSGCSICYQQVIDLNAAIPAWAASKTTSQSPVIVVDQWTGFDTVTDTSDGLHPNDAGNQKMSDKWYPALIQCLTVSGTTTPPTSATSTATRTATITATATSVTRTATITATSTTITRTATATRTSTMSRTATATRTATSGATRTTTIGPTITPVITPTVTATGGTCTCVVGCSSLTAITPNYSKDGVGQVCLTASSLGSYINSWNLTTLNVNGVDFTNKYIAAAGLPAKIGGLYYVYYYSTVSWGHFEVMN